MHPGNNHIAAIRHCMPLINAVDLHMFLAHRFQYSLRERIVQIDLL